MNLRATFLSKIFIFVFFLLLAFTPKMSHSCGLARGKHKPSPIRALPSAPIVVQPKPEEQKAAPQESDLLLFSNLNHLLLQISETNEKGSASKAKLYLAQNADPNATDSLGNTPLMWSSYHGNFRLVLALLNHGAKVSLINRYGDSAFTFAESERNELLKTFHETKNKNTRFNLIKKIQNFELILRMLHTIRKHDLQNHPVFLKLVDVGTFYHIQVFEPPPSFD